MSNRASTRRTRRSDTTTLKRNKRVFFYIFPRTEIYTEVFTSLFPSQIGTPLVSVWRQRKINLQCSAERGWCLIMKVWGKLDTLWLYPFLVCKQYKISSQKDSVLHSKVTMKGRGRDNHVFNATRLICYLTFQLFQTDKAFKVHGCKHTQSN